MGLLPRGALDLPGGWVDFPRPKTAVTRRVPLWPETIEAIEAYLAKRPAPKDPALADRVFVTKYGGSWYKPTSDNPVSAEFAKLMDAVDAGRAKEAKKKRRRAPEAIHRRGMGFYSFRHLFQTVGDGARDPIATRFIMGHAEAANDMSAIYREEVVAVERLGRCARPANAAFIDLPRSSKSMLARHARRRRHRF